MLVVNLEVVARAGRSKSHLFHIRSAFNKMTSAINLHSLPIYWSQNPIYMFSVQINRRILYERSSMSAKHSHIWPHHQQSNDVIWVASNANRAPRAHCPPNCLSKCVLNVRAPSAIFGFVLLLIIIGCVSLCTRWAGRTATESIIYIIHGWLCVRPLCRPRRWTFIIFCVYSDPNPETFYLCNKCHNFRMLRTLFRFAPYFIFLPGFLSDAIWYK